MTLPPESLTVEYRNDLAFLRLVIEAKQRTSVPMPFDPLIVRSLDRDSACREIRELVDRGHGVAPEKAGRGATYKEVGARPSTGTSDPRPALREALESAGCLRCADWQAAAGERRQTTMSADSRWRRSAQFRHISCRIMPCCRVNTYFEETFFENTFSGAHSHSSNAPESRPTRHA
jgi:hypothetical protein